MGGFEHPQIAEMAAALERSGYRFLWLHGRQHQRNSVQSDLWNGVPIATWPVYAEQQSNAFQLVKDLELAMQLTLDYRFKNPHKLVPFNEIEKAIRCLMDDENPVRRRVKEIGKKAIEALMDGGSSFISLRRFIEDPLVAQK
ncbi:putative UDP-glucose flavonoid 3-O-glucosyltransferase 3 [Coffea arabica]